MSEVSKYEDILNSRDIIARIEELRDMEGERDEEEVQELIALEALAEQAEGYCDWESGETLIRDSYFTQYAEQFADDIGAIDRRAGWPLCYIDWERAAKDLKRDYTAVEYDDVTYWVRS